MKIPLINDTHFGCRNDSLAFNDYFFRFWEEIFIPYLDANNITTIFHLGDVVDRRKFISFIIQNNLRTRFVDEIKKRDIDFHCLVGNHDTFYKNTNSVNAIRELFGEYKNVHVYEKPQTITFDNLDILLLPWINSENYNESFEKIKESKEKICFGHLEISGFEMDKNNVCYEGIDRKIFDKFDKVISGHFHHKSSDGKIHYLGSQYQMTWADEGDTKGFHVFDTDTKELEFIENPFKMFHKFRYDDKDGFDFETLKTMNLDMYTGTYVKVFVINKVNPFLFDTFITNLYAKSPLDISIVEDFTSISSFSDDDLEQAEDTTTILRKYIDGLEFDGDKEKLYNKTHALYIEAQNLEQI